MWYPRRGTALHLRGLDAGPDLSAHASDVVARKCEAYRPHRQHRRGWSLKATAKAEGGEGGTMSYSRMLCGCVKWSLCWHCRAEPRTATPPTTHSPIGHYIVPADGKSADQYRAIRQRLSSLPVQRDSRNRDSETGTL